MLLTVHTTRNVLEGKHLLLWNAFFYSKITLRNSTSHSKIHMALLNSSLRAQHCSRKIAYLENRSGFILNGWSLFDYSWTFTLTTRINFCSSKFETNKPLVRQKIEWIWPRSKGYMAHYRTILFLVSYLGWGQDTVFWKTTIPIYGQNQHELISFPPGYEDVTFNAWYLKEKLCT